MPRRRPALRERAGAAAMAALVVVAMGWALVAGLAVPLAFKPGAVMQLFTVAPPPPPSPVDKPPPPHPRQAAREGASAPPNRKSKATDVEAPEPVVPPLRPPPTVAAPVPSIGAEASSGAAPVAGPGTGAGGIGNGTGSGRFGDGPGGGGVAARIVKDVRFRDLPAPVRDALWRDPADYTVYVAFLVLPNGRATDCVVTRSSGYPALDAATCAGIVEHGRFTPELDAQRRPVAKRFAGSHYWQALGPGPAEGGAD